MLSIQIIEHVSGCSRVEHMSAWNRAVAGVEGRAELQKVLVCFRSSIMGSKMSRNVHKNCVFNVSFCEKCILYLKLRKSSTI